ncbi:MAG: dihydrodipicolinate synthase family protein [Candidatus Micrarchaeota archaeon]
MDACVTALVTPMRGGEVDFERFRRLAEFQVANGVREVVVNGTTGESPATSDAEKGKLIEVALDAGCRVVAGTGGNVTSHAERLTAQAQELGVKRCLLVDCYYNGPSSLELRREYYAPLCARFPEMRFTAYVIPARTGCELSVEDLAQLHREFENFDAVKEATGNLDRMRRTRAECPGIAIMSGDDEVTLALLTDPLIRGNGVVATMSNVAPAGFSRLCSLAADVEGARAFNDKLSQLFLATVKAGGQKFRNPVPVKTVMAGLGMVDYGVRRPLGRLSREGVGFVRDALRCVWRESPELLEPVAEFFDVDIGERIENDVFWVSY